MKLVSNAADGVTNLVNNSSYWSAATFGPNCEVYVTLGATPASGQDVALRIANPGASWTGYIIDVNGTTWNLYYHDAGGFHLIAGPIVQAVGAGDKIGLEAIGSQITAYAFTAGTWSSVMTVSDSNITGTGYIGMCSVNAGTGNTFDDFSGGTIGGNAPGMGFLLTGIGH